jgi:hypothetical protein
MEPISSLDASPELIWGIGIVFLGITFALAMIYSKHLSERERALRDHEARRNYARGNSKE